MYIIHAVLFLLILLFDISVSDARKHRQPQSIDPQIFSRVELFSHYSAAAYCWDNIIAEDRFPLVCHADAPCSLVASSNTSIFHSVAQIGRYAISGFIALDHDRNVTVVAFYGEDYRHNGEYTDRLFYNPHDSNHDNKYKHLRDLAKVGWLQCKGCKIQRVLNEAWIPVASQIMELAMPRVTKIYPDIVVNGHGQGGGLASIAALWLRVKGYNATLVEIHSWLKETLFTYGAPRIGNRQLVKHITMQGHNYRVTHECSKGPHKPPMNKGFRHFEPEYYMNQALELDAQLDNISLISGLENRHGNGGDDIRDDPKFNRYWFGGRPIDKCEEANHIQ